MGVRRRLSYFVLTFPYSNVGLAQVFPGENAEVRLPGLEGHLLLYRRRAQADNLRQRRRRRAQDGRQGADDRAVRALRRALRLRLCVLQPPPRGTRRAPSRTRSGPYGARCSSPCPRSRAWAPSTRTSSAGAWRFPEKATGSKASRRTGCSPRTASPSPDCPPSPSRWCATPPPGRTKKGKVRADGPHFYSTDPAFSGCEMLLGLGATTLRVFDGAGHVRLRARQSLRRRSDRHDGSRVAAPPPVPQACGWRRLARQGGACPKMSAAGWTASAEDELKEELRLLRDETARSGWGGDAPGRRARVTGPPGRIDRASVAVGAARIASGAEAIAYDEAGRPVRLRLRLLWKGGVGHGLPQARRRHGVESPHALDVLLRGHHRRAFLASATAGQVAAGGRDDPARDAGARAPQAGAADEEGEVPPDKVFRRVRLRAGGPAGGLLRRRLEVACVRRRGAGLRLPRADGTGQDALGDSRRPRLRGRGAGGEVLHRRRAGALPDAREPRASARAAS